MAGRSKLPKVPLDVAATGPKIMAMGAELEERVSFSLGADIERIRWGIGQVEAVLNQNKDNPKLPPSLGVYLNICIHNDINRAAELVRLGVGIFAHFNGVPDTNIENINQAEQTVFDALGKDYDKKRHGRGEASRLKKCRYSLLKDFH